jgi:dihydrofolate reductase
MGRGSSAAARGRGGKIRGWDGGVTSRRSTCRCSWSRHHAREPLTLSDTTFTFVTDGIESALDRAREAAAGQDVTIGGGADIIHQYLAARLIDELELNIVPLVLGGGARLFEGLGPDLELEQIRAVDGPGVTHLKYRVVQ